MITLTLALLLAVPAHARPSRASRALERAARDFQTAYAKAHPLEVDKTSPLPEFTSGAGRDARARFAELDRRLRRIPAAGLDPEEAITREALLFYLRREREAQNADLDAWNLDPSGALYAAHRKGFARLLSAREAALRRGLAAGKVPAAASVDAAARLFEGFPAYRRYANFLRKELLPRARPDSSPGLASLPGGKRLYRLLLRRHTGQSRDPKPLHEQGLAALAEIEARLKGPAPRGKFPSREAELAEARRLLERNRSAFAPSPARRAVVRPLPEDEAPFAPMARYDDGVLELGEAAPYELPALIAHEGIPGHHLERETARNAAALPEFRRRIFLAVHCEGWALYAESLAPTHNPEERFGVLAHRAWRAARLVVDTGLHEYGWSRERAETFLREHTRLSEARIKTEVVRLISSPGEGAAYWIGASFIESLRANAEKSLGKNFDRKRFHDAVLSGGALPPFLLEKRVRARLGF